jgi:hypothetical protein
VKTNFETLHTEKRKLVTTTKGNSSKQMRTAESDEGDDGDDDDDESEVLYSEVDDEESDNKSTNNDNDESDLDKSYGDDETSVTSPNISSRQNRSSARIDGDSDFSASGSESEEDFTQTSTSATITLNEAQTHSTYKHDLFIDQEKSTSLRIYFAIFAGLKYLKIGHIIL